MEADPVPPRPAPGGAFTPGGLLLGTLRAWWRNALAFSAVSLLAWAPIGFLLLRVAEKQDLPDPGLLLLFLWLLLGVVSAGAIGHGVLLDLGGTRPRLTALLAMVAGRLWPVFAISALYAATIVVGVFLFFLPALLALVSGYLAIPAVLAAPELDPVEALRRSWVLTHGHRLPLAAALVLLLGGALFLAWASFRFIDAATWIPPIPGSITWLVLLALVHGLLQCCAPVAFHQLKAVAPPGFDAEPMDL